MASCTEQMVALGSRTGFGIGALPGACLGASVFGLAGAALGGASQAGEAALVALDDGEELSYFRQDLEWSSGAGAAHGAKVFAALSGASLGVPLALLGGVVGGAFGLLADTFQFVSSAATGPFRSQALPAMDNDAVGVRPLAPAAGAGLGLSWARPLVPAAASAGSSAAASAGSSDLDWARQLALPTAAGDTWAYSRLSCASARSKAL